MKLKNKTELRKEVITRAGTTGMFEYLSVSRFGYWVILSQNTVDDGDYRIRLSEFKSNPFGDLQKQITATLRRIEKESENHFSASVVG